MRGRLCVIGWPVEHSKSPLLHNAMLGALGLDYEYLCQPVKPGELEGFLEEARAGAFVGFNVTMPFKTQLAQRVDVLDPLAEKLQAVNTVCIKEGKLYGYNTDCPGFIAALREAGFDPAGRRIALLGAGGAARAVAVGLCDAGAAHVTVCNRTLEKGAALAALYPDIMSTEAAGPAGLARGAAGAELLVNGTNLGMEGSPQFSDFSFLDALAPGAVVADLIYHPAETVLLKEARRRGHPVMNGLPLLLHQAILALERFVERPIPPESVLPLLHRALGA